MAGSDLYIYSLFYRMGEKATNCRLESRKNLIAQCLVETKFFFKVLILIATENATSLQSVLIRTCSHVIPGQCLSLTWNRKLGKVNKLTTSFSYKLSSSYSYCSWWAAVYESNKLVLWAFDLVLHFVMVLLFTGCSWPFWAMHCWKHN